MARNTAHSTRCRIVNNSAQHVALFVVFGSGRDARDPLLWGQEARVFHAQGREDVVAGLVGKRNGRNLFHDEAERLKVDVAIARTVNRAG